LIFNNSSSIALRKLQKSDKKCDALIGFLDKEVSKIEFERVLMRFWEVDKTISQNIEKEGTLEFLPLLETAIKQLLIHFADFSKKETTDDDRTLVHKVFVEKLDRMLDYYDRIKKDANYPQYPCVLEARGILAEGTPAYLRTMVLA